MIKIGNYIWVNLIIRDGKIVKIKMSKENDGFEPSTVYRQLKMEAPDGKKELRIAPIQKEYFV